MLLTSGSELRGRERRRGDRERESKRNTAGL